MASLNTLPFETLTQILSTLPNADLAHVSRVSSRLCAVAEPLLYKAPYLSERKRPLLTIFLRTLLLPGRQSLATHVKSFRIDWYGVSCEQDSPNTPRLPHSPESDVTELIFLLHLLSSLKILEIVFVDAPSDSTRLLESHDVQPSTLPLALPSLRKLFCSFLGICGTRARTILAPLHPLDSYAHKRSRRPHHACCGPYRCSIIHH